jgi:hypothetical protein
MEKTKKEETTEKYYLTDKIRNEGFYCKLKDKEIIIDFERDFNKQRRSQFASVGYKENGVFVSENQNYLTGLSSEMVYILAIAKVIKLSKDQRKVFTDYLKTIKRKTNEDD